MAEPTSLRLDDQLCFALYAADQAMNRAYRPLLDRVGLTYPQYLVMIVLWEHDARSVSEIAQRLMLPGHALSPILDRLEDAGIVTRRHDHDDRRVRRVELTTKGTKLRFAASEVATRVASATGLDAQSIEDLRSQLRGLAERLALFPAAPEPAPP